MAINWELGRIDPNIATNTLAALQAGRQQRNQTLRENALRAYAQTGQLNPDLAAVDPAAYAQFRQQDAAQQTAKRTESRETLTRHMTGTAQVFQALVRAVPDAPVDPANPAASAAAQQAVLDQRRALAPHLIQSRSDVWDDPEDMAKAVGALSSPNANFSTQNLMAAIQAAGIDPNSGRRILHPNDVEIDANGLVTATGASEPVVQGSLWHQPVLPRVGTRMGADQPAISAAPPPAQPQQAAPGGAQGNVAAVFATPQDRADTARYIQSESGHGPGEDAAILSTLVTNAAAAGMSASQFLHANPTFSYGFSRGNSAVRNFDPNGPQGQRYGELIDSMVNGQTPVQNFVHFEGASFPVRPFEHNPVTIGRTRFTAGGAPAAAGQTAPAAAPDDSGLPPGYHRIPPQATGNGPMVEMTMDDARHLHLDHVPPGAYMQGGVPHYAPAQIGTQPTVSASAIEEMAQESLLNPHVVDRFGSGAQGAANRTAVLNRRAQILQQQGTSPAEAYVRTAGVHSAEQALTRQTNLRSTTAGFLRTLEANLDQVERLAPHGVSGQIPVFNRWIANGRRALAGDPELTAFDVAIRTAALESAKISEGNTGSSGASVEAARAADRLINSYQNLGQVMASSRQMRIDGHNRLDSLDSVIGDLRDTIRDHHGTADQGPQVPAGGGAAAGLSVGGGSTSPLGLGRPRQAPQTRPQPLRTEADTTPRRTAPAATAAIPTLSPAQARAARPGTLYRTTDGRTLVR